MGKIGQLRATYRCKSCGREASYAYTAREKFERCRLFNDVGVKCLGTLECVSKAWRTSGQRRRGPPPLDIQEPSQVPVLDDPIEDSDLEEEELPVPAARKYQRRSEGARGGGGASTRGGDEVADAFPEHPLFPFSDDDDEGFDVSFIQITRWEGGKQVWGPTLPAAELQSELAIQEQFGGGVYVLLAKRPLRSDRSKPGSVTKSRKVSLPGRSKPLSSDPTAEEIAAFDPSTRAASQSAAGGAPFTGGGGFEQVLLAMMSMQQQTAERAAAENRESARRESENSKAFMTMFLGMMNSSKSDSASMVQMMMTLSAQQQQSMVSLLPALIGARGGGPEEMAKFAELFRTLGFAQPGKGGAVTKDDDNSIGAILSNGADILQGFLALKGGLNGAAPAVGEVAPQLAAPGSAAEMLERMRRGG